MKILKQAEQWPDRYRVNDPIAVEMYPQLPDPDSDEDRVRKAVDSIVPGARARARSQGLSDEDKYVRWEAEQAQREWRDKINREKS